MDEPGAIVVAETGGTSDRPLARTLDAIARHAATDAPVCKSELCPGDQVIVTTRNSVYRLQFVGGETFLVTGGWFDRQRSAGVITVNGCTYGGSTIRHDVVAALGLFLEFGNSVTTTRIQNVHVVRATSDVAALPC